MGHAFAYRWRLQPRVRRHRTRPVVLKVVPLGGAAFASDHGPTNVRLSFSIPSTNGGDDVSVQYNGAILILLMPVVSKDGSFFPALPGSRLLYIFFYRGASSAFLNLRNHLSC